MSLDDVDTLNMLFDKLENLFNESQGYYESFLDANNLYKSGKMDQKEFFGKLGDYVVAYSALEFLAVKVMFEIRKALNRPGQGSSPQQGTMPGAGMPGMAGMPFGGQPGIPPGMANRMGTPSNPVGAPPGVISAQNAFSAPGTLPSPDPELVPSQDGACASCGKQARPGAKFCTGCGASLA